MLLDLSERSDEEEIMDDFALGGPEFQDGLDQIANINFWLGGNSITISSLRKMFSSVSGEITVLDAGCGNGDMCRQVAKLARKMNKNVKIIGVDANPGTVIYAQELSEKFPEIKYFAMDIFSAEFDDLKYDILLATLTLHHFDDKTITSWILKLCDQGKSIIINDLHRSKLSYRLFQLISFIFNLNKMNRNDGLISIKRGFKKKDFYKYNQLINKANTGFSITLKWRWAFRYLWIIEKI